MNKKNYYILLILLSLAGASLGIYTKYVKSYLNEIETETISRTGENYSAALNLGESIAFMEGLAKMRSEHEIKTVKKDNSAEVLERLKTVNIFSIAILVVSIFLFFWCIQKIQFLSKLKN